MAQLSFTMLPNKKSIRADGKTIAALGTTFFTAFIAIVTCISFFKSCNTNIPFNSYMETNSSSLVGEISPTAKVLTETYRKHWLNNNINPNPCYCTLTLINNSSMCLTNILIKFTLTVNDDTPLKKYFIKGNTTFWTEEIMLIDPGKYPMFTVIDISPFYSGSLSWQIIADNPHKNGQRITIEKGTYSINNSQNLILKNN